LSTNFAKCQSNSTTVCCYITTIIKIYYGIFMCRRLNAELEAKTSELVKEADELLVWIFCVQFEFAAGTLTQVSEAWAVLAPSTNEQMLGSGVSAAHVPMLSQKLFEIGSLCFKMRTTMLSSWDTK